MINVEITQGYHYRQWDVEFSWSCTVPAAFQNEEKIDSLMKKGFVEKVSLELTFRNKSNVVTGNPSLVIIETAEEISGSKVKNGHKHSWGSQQISCFKARRSLLAYSELNSGQYIGPHKPRQVCVQWGGGSSWSPGLVFLSIWVWHFWGILLRLKKQHMPSSSQLPEPIVLSSWHWDASSRHLLEVRSADTALLSSSFLSERTFS